MEYVESGGNFGKIVRFIDRHAKHGSFDMFLARKHCLLFQLKLLSF